MKHKIKNLGVLYSALSDRGRDIKRHKRTHRRETTVKAVSILAAFGITTLKTVATA